MPIQKTIVSSLSGDVIPAGTGARVRILWADDERADMRADLTTAEAEKLAKQFKLEDVVTRPERRR